MSFLLVVLAVSVLAFAVFETAFGRRARPDRGHLGTDLAYVVSDFLGNLGVNALRPGFPLGVAWLLGHAWKGPLAGTSLAVQVVAGALLLELLIWFAHWCWHRFDVLYPFHAVHHGTTNVYFLSGLRQHPVQFVGDQLFFALALTLVGVTPEVVGLLAVVQMVAAFFTHSNLDVGLGPLEYVICSPRFHILHHDATGSGARKNLGGGLSVFDWIFGTALDPDVQAPPRELGSGDATFPSTYAGQLVYPFKELSK